VPSPEATEADPSTALNTQTRSTQSGAAKMIEAVYSASIDFYGKVIDQHGNPVPHARVTCSVSDNFFGTGSTRKSDTDASGSFTVKNIRGAGVLVSVGKDGYAEIKDKSGASFGIGMPADTVRKAPPTKQKPAIFVLRKMAKPEKMIFFYSSVIVPKNGNPVDISLRTGKAVGAGLGDLRVECWIKDEEKDEKRRFDWSCRFTIPGGGLVDKNGDIENQAPEAGYEPSITIQMPRTAENWVDQYESNSFIKLGNGNFARARICMVAGGANFVSLQVYLNPSGSRNLEYDKKLDLNQ
jgi:hypothetical protein